MTGEALAVVLRQALLALGALFVVVNARVGWDIARWFRLRRTAVVVWPGPRPPFYTINLSIGVLLGLLLLVTVGVGRPPASIFGVAMMFTYYGYLLPMSTRIRRGLYGGGIWTDSGFMPYGDISGVAWKGESSTLILASRTSATARRLEVPGAALGEVRRILREKIGSHAIPVDDGPGLHLGNRDSRESV